MEVTEEEEEIPLEKGVYCRLEWPGMAALGTIVVTNTAHLTTTQVTCHTGDRKELSTENDYKTEIKHFYF